MHESTVLTGSAKEGKALAPLEAPDTKVGRYKAPDLLLRFLQTL